MIHSHFARQSDISVYSLPTYLIDCLFKGIRRAPVHLQMPQPVVIAGVHHGAQDGVLAQIRQTQTALEDAIWRVDLQKNLSLQGVLRRGFYHGGHFFKSVLLLKSIFFYENTFQNRFLYNMDCISHFPRSSRDAEKNVYSFFLEYHFFIKADADNTINISNNSIIQGKGEGEAGEGKESRIGGGIGRGRGREDKRAERLFFQLAVEGVTRGKRGQYGRQERERKGQDR